MSKKIILSILFLCLLPATFVWAQDGNSLSKAEKTALHEARLDSGVLKNPKLVDAYPDSMWYDNASYIFCRSPLYQRNGYTAIFSDYFNGEAVGYGWPRGGWRGYR
ncbi:MAG: hypothetical protein LBR06_04455, partial [Bacteroidales bacterium]|nr:hypothetical protein [Bacteroidales bacterium]